MPAATMIKQIESYPIEDRVMMADAIIASLNGARPEYEEAWSDVSELRLAELRLGKVKGVAGGMSSRGLVAFAVDRIGVNADFQTVAPISPFRRRNRIF